MKQRLLPLGLTISALSGPIEAQNPGAIRAFQSGIQLNSACQTDTGFCMGYVAGVADAMSLVQVTGGNLAGVVACIPFPVVIGQAKDVAAKYLHEHPELQGYTAVNLVAFALRDAFPCPQSPPKP
jgi:hypothetical protein